MPLCLSKLEVGAGMYPSRFRRIRSATTPITTRMKTKPRAMASAMSTMKPLAREPPVKRISIEGGMDLS